jgi:NADP-dependent 3-hydroxy acid dehydrogenase YdfG
MNKSLLLRQRQISSLDLQLSRKLLFVTGSTAGIRFATTESLVDEGACVIANGKIWASSDASQNIRESSRQFRVEAASLISEA